MIDRRRRRTAQLIVAVAAVVTTASVVAFVPWNGDDNNNGSEPQPTFSPGALLDAGGTQLASLLTGARDHTFHARYAVRGSAELIGGSLQLEWWNTKDHSRIDTTRTRDGQVVRTASFVNGDEGAGCQSVDSGDWSCRKIDVPAPGDPGGIITNLTSQLAGRPVTQRAGKVDGRAALCFHVGGGTEPIDICTNSDGVMLRNASAKVVYEISTLDAAVPDSIFDPPATVS
jgi:hypothetical protein